MDNQRTNHRTNNIQRQHDDWNEVHHQLLAIQKKSLEVSIIFPFLLLFSCGAPKEKNIIAQQNKISLEKIFESIADTNASICITKNKLVLYTQFENELAVFNEQQYNRFAKIFTVAIKDSLALQRPGIGLTEKDFLTQYLLTEKQATCYDSLDSYVFQYDSIFPVQLKLMSDEKMNKIKNTTGLSVCTTFNATQWETFMYLSVNGKYFSTEIAGEREIADFFLCDITGDALPEIFVVKHFMMPSTVVGDTPMINLEIYKVSIDD